MHACVYERLSKCLFPGGAFHAFSCYLDGGPLLVAIWEATWITHGIESILAPLSKTPGFCNWAAGQRKHSSNA